MSKSCKIKEIITLVDGYSCPILTHFQNGEVFPEKTTIDWNLARQKDDKNSKIVVACTPSNIYSGRVGEGYPTDLVNSFIAVRNKKTNKMRIIQVEESSMLNEIYNNNSSKSANIITDSWDTMMKKFGGKKAQKILDKREKMKVNIDVVQEELDVTVNQFHNNNSLMGNDEMDMSSSIVTTKETDPRKSITPPKNENATNVREIYSLSDILTESVLKKLKKYVKMALEMDAKDLSIESSILSNMVKAVLESKDKDSEVNEHKIASCLYMEGLMNLLTKHKPNALLKDAKISQIKPVAVDIRERFGHPEIQSDKKSTFTTQKTICHLLVLLLLQSDKFRLNVNELVDDIKISRSEILKFANLIGAPSKEVDSTTFIQLKLNYNPNLVKFKRQRR